MRKGRLAGRLTGPFFVVKKIYANVYNRRCKHVSGEMTYDQQILKVLLIAGDKGISVQMLSKHLYNMNCSLFYVPDYMEIHNYVKQYILRNLKSPRALIEHAGKRGLYRLNSDRSIEVGQLVLEFTPNVTNIESADEVSEKRVSDDFSLDLFA